MTRPRSDRTATIPSPVKRVGSGPVASTADGGRRRRPIGGLGWHCPVRAPDQSPDQQANLARLSGRITARGPKIPTLDPRAPTLSP
jgi:hypothetical protein